jgi:replicative DNA helicase
VVLHGQAGDPIVKLYHRKPVVLVLGPWDVLFGQDGEVSLHGKPNLVQLLRYSRDGVTAKDAAMLLYDTEKPTTSETERARRALDGLVRTGVAVRVDGKRGGAQPEPARWFLRGPELAPGG